MGGVPVPQGHSHTHSHCGFSRDLGAEKAVSSPYGQLALLANRSSHADSGPTHTGLLRLGSLRRLFMSLWPVGPSPEPGSCCVLVTFFLEEYLPGPFCQAQAGVPSRDKLDW